MKVQSLLEEYNPGWPEKLLLYIINTNAHGTVKVRVFMYKRETKKYT